MRENAPLGFDPGPLWLNKNLNVRRVPGSPMIEIEGVKGFLLGGDVTFLIEQAGRVPPGGTVVEIGSFMGLSTILFVNGLVASGNLNAKMYCVDTWQGSPEHQGMAIIKDDGLFREFLRNIERAGVRSFVQPIRMPSTEGAAMFAPASVDFLFVDGDHSYEGCKADLDAWFPKLKPGGILIGHDCAPGGGVEQAVQEFARERGAQVTVTPPPGAHYMFECRF